MARNLFESRMAVALRRSNLCLAFSGGADTTLLYFWVQDWSRRQRRKVTAIHVHHGNSYSDILARRFKALIPAGVVLEIPKQKNHEQERILRYEQLTSYTKAKGGALLLGHQRDDNAETFIMRVSSASSWLGLSGMEGYGFKQGCLWLRPLLDLPRKWIEDYLEVQNLIWFQDPENLDLRFSRNYIRSWLKQNPTFGTYLSQQNLGGEKKILERDLRNMLQDGGIFHSLGYFTLDQSFWQRQPNFLKVHALRRIIHFIGQNQYAPSWQQVANLMGTNFSLGRCLIFSRRNKIWIVRETRNLPIMRESGLWDKRFVVENGENLLIAPMQGTQQDIGIPLEIIRSLPAAYDSAGIMVKDLLGISGQQLTAYFKGLDQI